MNDIFNKKFNLDDLLYWILGGTIVYNIRILILEYYINGRPNYFLTEYLNFSDILIVIIIFFNIFKLKKVNLLNPFISIIFIILFGQVFNDTYPLLSFYQILRLLGIVYLGTYLINTKKIIYILNGFFIALFSQVFILITQFILQKNLNLPIITESVFNRDMVGIAKLNFGDNFLIRGYGTFPHPNILAFTGLMGIIFLIYNSNRKLASWFIFLTLIIISQVDHYLWTFNQSLLLTFLAILVSVSNFKLGLKKYQNNILLAFCMLMIILSFSKSIYILSGFLIFIFIIKKILTQVFSKEMFHIEHFKKYFDLIFFIIFSIFFSSINFILFSLNNSQSAFQRVFYLKESFEVFYINLFNGIGTKQFILGLQNQNLEFWQLQPVHNLSLLILTENGIIGLFILLACLMFWMYYLVKKTYVH